MIINPKLVLLLIFLLSGGKKKPPVGPPGPPEPAPQPAPQPQPQPKPAPQPQPKPAPQPQPKPAPQPAPQPKPTPSAPTGATTVATITKSSGPLPPGFVVVPAVHAPSAEAAWMQSVSGQLALWEWTQHATGYIARREPLGGGMTKMVLYGHPAASGMKGPRGGG